MSEKHGKEHHGHGSDAGFDSEVDVRSLVKFTVAILVLTIGSMGLMFGLNKALVATSVEKNERPPSPLAEANKPAQPVGPLLEVSPPRNWQTYKKAEAEHLKSYGWIEKEKGVAHIPIERAIDIVAEKGLPEPPPVVVTAPAPPSGATTSAAPAPAVAPK
ncbi:MAG: hypothetical protein JNK60_14460 [Acidobacteria bacterium]|nr:hypothetical protein [Acidobacteriota bacterium]